MSALASELIIDGADGARTVKFSEMGEEELKRRARAFPEALVELVKRFPRAIVTQQN